MIGAVYSSFTGRLRRVIAPGDGKLDWKNHPILKGETILELTTKEEIEVRSLSNVIEIADHITLQEIEVIIEQYRGKPTDQRDCAVVDENGLIEAKIVADPQIDSIPGKTLMLAPAEIGVGDFYKDGKFELQEARKPLPIPEPKITFAKATK